MRKCLSGYAHLEERFWLWVARNCDRWADWVEARCGKLWFVVPGWRWKARMFRWFAGLDRQFTDWLEK